MNYRELKEGETLQAGDQLEVRGTWMDISNSYGGKVDTYAASYRRPLPEPTFEESADFEPSMIIGKEPVSMFDACANNEPDKLDREEWERRRRNDETPFAEAKAMEYEISQHSADEVIYPKADRSSGDMNLINNCDDPIFNIVLKRAINPSNAMDITNMLRCAGVTHPKDDERQAAIDEALDFFAMMDAPSPEQLGVLYDAGYRLTKES